MAQYRVVKQSFINGQLFNEGDLVEYDGDVHDNLELVKKIKKGDPVPDPEVGDVTEQQFGDAPTGV
jgi:hypothetical protein